MGARTSCCSGAGFRLIPLRSYTHFVAIKGRFVGPRGHVRTHGFLKYAQGDYTHLRSTRLRSYTHFVALRGRGLRSYSRLVAAGFAFLGTHLQPSHFFRGFGSTHISLSDSSQTLFGPQGFALAADAFGQSSSCWDDWASRIHTSGSTCGFHTHSGPSGT